MQRFLDPTILSSISGLELIAKTVVDGFVSGLHRSPDFGFSQEFAEYRAYSEGDDLRHVDWNVFARTERMYLKRYRGETNTQLTMLLDASASMSYGSHAVNKLDFTGKSSADVPVKGRSICLEEDSGCVWISGSDGLYRISPEGKLIWAKEANHSPTRWMCTVGP